MRDRFGIVFAIAYNMKYLAIILPAIALAIHWGEGAGFLVLCVVSLIILKMWEHEQRKKKSN